MPVRPLTPSPLLDSLVQVENVVMVKVRDAEHLEELPMEGVDDVLVEEVAAGPEPVLWPAVRSMASGGVECKHVLVYGNQSTEAAGDDHGFTCLLVRRLQAPRIP